MLHKPSSQQTWCIPAQQPLGNDECSGASTTCINVSKSWDLHLLQSGSRSDAHAPNEFECGEYCLVRLRVCKTIRKVF